MNHRPIDPVQKRSCSNIHRTRPATAKTTHSPAPATQASNHLQILEHLPVFVYLLTSDYTFSYVNTFFRKNFGIPDQLTRCYSILRKSHEPCDSCPAMAVFADKKERIWQWNDTMRGKMYQIHDIPYGDSDETMRVLGVGIPLSRTEKNIKSDKPHASTDDDFLRICCYCNKIHNKAGHWQRVEAYFAEAQHLRFSHSICPQCMHLHYPEISITAVDKT